MDKRMEGMLESLESNTPGLGDTFRLKCRECGKFRKNRDGILLAARDPRNIARQACHLLRGSRCAAHAAKPAVCALFPLGRAVRIGMESMGSMGSEAAAQMKALCFAQPMGCGSRGSSHAVRSWLEKFGIPVEDEFHSLWNEAIFFLSGHFRDHEAGKAPAKAMDALWSAAFHALHANFDTNAELIPQFQASIPEFKAAPANLEDALKKPPGESA
jgi:Fe-S-cluster containining protein